MIIFEGVQSINHNLALNYQVFTYKLHCQYNWPFLQYMTSGWRVHLDYHYQTAAPLQLTCHIILPVVRQDGIQ